MWRVVVDALTAGTDVDILRAFSGLGSDSDRVRALHGVLRFCEESRSAVVRHRCLLVLARLIEEEAAARPEVIRLFLEQGGSRIHSLANHTESGQSQPTWHDSSAWLRRAAARQLREAILASCPRPIPLAGAHGSRSSFRTPLIELAAPVRLDLGMGGIADVPPFSLERYGNCVNVPVLIGGILPLRARAQVSPRAEITLASVDLGVTRSYRRIDELSGETPAVRLHEEVVRFWLEHLLGLQSAEELFARLGGGLAVSTESSLSAGMGLGTSSLLLCLLLKAVGTLFDIWLTPDQLLAASVYVENVAGVGGGWEDATALFPGFKLMESFPEEPLRPRARSIELAPLSLHRLQTCLVLLHTGIAKPRQGFFDTIVERYCLREATVLKAIEYNCALNRELATALSAADLAVIGDTMNAQWHHWKALSAGGCTTPEIDDLFTAVCPCVHGARMNGSGQGGCAMFAVREGQQERLCAVVQEVLQGRAISLSWEPVL